MEQIGKRQICNKQMERSDIPIFSSGKANYAKSKLIRRLFYFGTIPRCFFVTSWIKPQRGEIFVAYHSPIKPWRCSAPEHISVRCTSIFYLVNFATNITGHRPCTKQLRF